jgi:hypothetical protein
VYDVSASDVVIPGCMLLILAWSGILMWRTVNPARPLFVAAVLPAIVASALVATQMAIGGTHVLGIVTIYLCVAAVIMPFGIMTRHQLVRLIEVVFPTARLVRRRRR